MDQLVTQSSCSPPDKPQPPESDEILDDLLAALEHLMRTRPKAVAQLHVQAVQARVCLIPTHARPEVRQ
jgi:hypothetical protein